MSLHPDEKLFEKKRNLFCYILKDHKDLKSSVFLIRQRMIH